MPARIDRMMANTGLRTMVVVLVVLVLVCFGIAQFALTSTIYSNAMAARQTYVEDRAEQLRVQTDLLVENITSIGKELAFNALVLKYVDADRMNEKLIAYNGIQVLLEAVAMSNPSIQTVFLTDFDHVHFGNTETFSFALKRRVVSWMDGHGWPAAQVNLSLEESGDRTLVCVTPSFERNKKQLYVVIAYDLAGIETLLDMTDGDESSVLVDQGGERLFSRGPADGAARDGGIRAVSHATLLNWHWEVTDASLSAGPRNQVTMRFVLALDAVLAGMLLLFLVLHDRTVIRPIARVTRFLDQNADGQNKARLNMRSQNEIGRIAQEIDRMLDGVERANAAAWSAQQNVYALKIARQQARFNALQSQINPHFLYNTLECVRGIAMAHGMDDILDICTFMADMFRYSIKGGEFVRLREELEIVHEYMGIMQIRQNNRYHVEIDVPEAAMDARIPRMTLQPVVENAVFHGLERTYLSPSLTVSARLCDEGIELKVRDNGVGISAEALQKLQAELKHAPEDGSAATADKDSIGLVNINDRIRLSCGERYGLRIESTEGKGTTVTIVLPDMNTMVNE